MIASAARPSLLCAGNLTVDVVVDPSGAQTEVPGGDALYAALAARLAGGDPHILAPVGDDAPATLSAALELVGCDVDQLPKRGLPTVRNVVRYRRDGGREWELVHGEEHFAAMSPRPEDATGRPDTDGILLSGMALGPQLELAVWAQQQTGSTYFDPQEDYLDGHERELLDAVGRCDVFMPSEVECVALAGTTDLEVAAAAFLRLGPSLVVVKLAEAGCLVATAGQQPSHVDLHHHDDDDANGDHPSAPVVDPTGAGDAFCGAFSVEHLRSGDPLQAARLGHRIARLAVGMPGPAGLLDALAARQLQTVRNR